MPMLGGECPICAADKERIVERSESLRENPEIAQIPYSPYKLQRVSPPFAGLFWPVNLGRSSFWYVYFLLLNHLGPTLHPGWPIFPGLGLAGPWAQWRTLPSGPLSIMSLHKPSKLNQENRAHIDCFLGFLTHSRTN